MKRAAVPASEARARMRNPVVERRAELSGPNHMNRRRHKGNRKGRAKRKANHSSSMLRGKARRVHRRRSKRSIFTALNARLGRKALEPLVFWETAFL